ncbi:DUF4365 domain-containing protein [Massilia niabensis]|uniref:DUF4365 domain-containing protein n=1 Tax=Massilia niabensis TaxID=544910 RepID=A0ABW0KXR2_9BURK
MSFSPVERIGVHSVALQILREFGWSCREQFVDDWGIDAQLEIVDDGKLTGRLIGMQIKSGKSYFKEEVPEGFVFRGKSRHLTYWKENSLPVILVLYNPQTTVAHWQIVRDDFVERLATGWKIVVPRKNTLSKPFKSNLRAIALPKHADRRRYDYLAGLINGFTDKPVTSSSAVHALYASFFAAQTEICIMVPFLSVELLDALSVAALSVRVRILFGKVLCPSIQLSGYLENAPRMTLRSPGSGMLHSKIYLLDSKLCTFTSSSLNLSVAKGNPELFWVTSDNTLVQETNDYFEDTWAKLG